MYGKQVQTWVGKGHGLAGYVFKGSVAVLPQTSPGSSNLGVKQGWTCLVLVWGTAWQYWVLEAINE